MPKCGRFRKTTKKEDAKIIEVVKNSKKTFTIDEIQTEIEKFNIYYYLK
jgi:hypothetical protein